MWRIGVVVHTANYRELPYFYTGYPRRYKSKICLQQDDEVQLLAFAESAIYGVELGLLESNAAPYRVGLIRISQSLF